MNSSLCATYPGFYAAPSNNHSVPPDSATGGPVAITLKKILEPIQARRYAEAYGAYVAWCHGDALTADISTRFRAALLGAHARLGMGEREAGLRDLGQALALGRESGQGADTLREAPEILVSLCAIALEEAIEPAYVTVLIGQAGLAPPTPILTRWPYPVRLYTLGRAAIVVRGQPLRCTGKARRRPIQLLHCLLARGGRAVPVALLRKAMLDDPDEADIPASRGAFDMALGRLRRMLEVDDALILGDGLLTLNEAVCWVDAWACERLLGQVEQARQPVCGVVLLERALALYQGDFFAGDETVWSILARERIRARILRVARRLGDNLEDTGQWAEAGRLYARLRELFPLDEELCRHLIRSHVERAEWAQATGIYARCRELLAKVLGVLPSPATRALLEGSRQ